MVNEIIAHIRRSVAVGVDGSPASLQATHWAAGEAVRRGGPLRLVAAALSPMLQPLGVEQVAPARTRDALAGAAAEALAEAALVAAQAAPGLEVVRELRGGSAPLVLMAESEWAGVLVVGTRGRGRVSAFLSGSMVVTVTAIAMSPVVVVRGDLDTAGLPGAPVVVAADGSAAGNAARRFAVDAAAARAAPLVVVHSGTAHVPPDETVGVGPAEHVARAEDARQVLPELSHGAALVVVGVGAHGRRLDGPAAPVVRELLRTSACPVAVVRHLASR
ncbi:universal stress protein [Pseudonocardia sp.]|uniref:universal stress protein n=1 Tax=Pseudonocardia sp. TaxID=60912 RepID=UPI003D0F3BB9